MMWFLNSENDKRVMYILHGNDITIGRSIDPEICNFAIPDDASISRKHVTLSTADKNLYLEDLGSKYGTFLNNSVEKIEHNVKMQLNCNDIVKFGKMGSVWKVNCINFTTCTSTLKTENFQSLNNNLNKLGGVLKSNWDTSCSYLTMPAITLTIKVVLALVQNSYIVTTDFWNKCVQAVNSNTTLPNPSNFVPHISEPSLNQANVSFLPSMKRCTLFAGKQILFFSKKQLELYSIVLTKSGGSAALLNHVGKTKSELCDSKVIVIQYSTTPTNTETQEQRNLINEITEYLKSMGKRTIADAEIGLAILYCSTSKYCNPAFHFTSEVVKQLSNEKKVIKILAQESQEPSEVAVKRENVEIDESLKEMSGNHLSNTTSNNEKASSVKRKFSDDNENPELISGNKKIATDLSELRDNKRPAEDLNELSNPSKKRALISEDNEEMFKFMEDTHKTNPVNDNTSNKKLNLLKPQKRKLDCMDDDDEGLFDFVEDNKNDDAKNDDAKNDDNLDVQKKLKTHDTRENHNSNKNTEDIIDTAALRGIKLQELMKSNANIKCVKEIKKEDTSDLNEMLSNVDLGSTVVVIKNDLIIKREPTLVVVAENGLKNFKKFKKVWPVKLQITLVSNMSDSNNTDKVVSEPITKMSEGQDI